jgi:hypothetical protein
MLINDILKGVPDKHMTNKGVMATYIIYRLLGRRFL